MLATELMDKLQKLIDDNGDAEIHIYKSFEKETIPINEVKSIMMTKSKIFI